MLLTRRFSRVNLLASFVVLFVLTCAWIARAQQPPANEEDNFTGKAFRLESKGYGLSRRGFEAAARSNWHTHDGAQLLFVEEGRMRAQVEGQPMKEVGKARASCCPAVWLIGTAPCPRRRPRNCR